MAQQLRALAALPEDSGLKPRSHKVAHNCNSSFKRPDALFCPPWAPGTHVVHRHTYRQAKHTEETKLQKLTLCRVMNMVRDRQEQKEARERRVLLREKSKILFIKIRQ